MVKSKDIDSNNKTNIVKTIIDVGPTVVFGGWSKSMQILRNKTKSK